MKRFLLHLLVFMLLPGLVTDVTTVSFVHPYDGFQEAGCRSMPNYGRQAVTPWLEFASHTEAAHRSGALVDLLKVVLDRVNTLPPLDPEIRALLSRLKTGDARERSTYCVIAAPWLDEIALREPIISWLSDKDPELKKAALEALARFIPVDFKLQSFFLGALNDRDAHVKETAVIGLAPLAARDKKIRRSLRAMLDDSSPDVRGAAADALASLLPSDPLIRNAFIRRLEHELAGDQSARVVAGIKEALLPTATLAELLDWLSLASTPAIRREIILALAPEAHRPEVRPALERWALSSADGPAEGRLQDTALTILMRGATREEMLRWLKYPGSPGMDAVIRVLALQATDDLSIREQLKIALWTDLDEYVPLLEALAPGATALEIDAWLASDRFLIQAAAVQALAGRAKKDVSIKKKILLWMRHNDRHGRERVNAGAAALSESATVDELFEWLTKESLYSPERKQVFAAYARQVPRSQLLSWLDDGNLQIQDMAIKALGPLSADDPFRLPVAEVITRRPAESAAAFEALAPSASYEEVVQWFDVPNPGGHALLMRRLGQLAAMDERARKFLSQRVETWDWGESSMIETISSFAFEPDILKTLVAVSVASENPDVRRQAALALRQAGYGRGATVDDIWKDSRRFTAHTILDHHWLSFLHNRSHGEFLDWIASPEAQERAPIPTLPLESGGALPKDAGVILISGPDVRWAGRAMGRTFARRAGSDGYRRNYLQSRTSR